MEENDLNEEVDTQVEETETTEVEETTTVEDANTPTLEDYEKLKKEAETLKAQKEHWRKKATQTPLKVPEPKKTNEDLPTRDELYLVAKGYDKEEIARLKLIANGKDLDEAVNDEMFIAWKEKKDARIRSEKAQLGASGGSSKAGKPVEEMTPAEHEAYYRSLYKK